ncbi:MAG: capsular polysaccharide synthesis protein [Bacteroidales bacterium]|nr:capsular polysaccharide synthesis protein [Bacteroidales bacterium]
MSLLPLLKTRYTQLGGLRLVRQYAKMGLLWPAAKMVLRHPFSKQTYKQVYLDTVRKVEPMLVKEYRPVMKEIVERVRNEASALEHKRNKIIWFCWLQGIENAPEVVKACYNSLVHGEWFRVNGYEVKVIDEKNWREYIDLPDNIIRRREKKQIPPAHFSDLLRLELLIRYGGTWIDSTVLCTGVNNDNENANVNYLDTDLFMFQYTQPGSSEWGGIGNWFITACTNNEVLMVLRDMLYAYWREHDCVLNYYLFHLFFGMLREVFPEQIAAMPYAYAPRSLALVHHWGERFDEAKWKRLTERVCFHKLTYMKDKVPAKVEGTYYEYILNNIE